MLLEIFAKTVLLPVTLISLFVLASGFLKGFAKDLLQSLILLLGTTWALFLIRGGVGHLKLGGMEAVLVLPSLIFLSFLLKALPFLRSLSRLIAVLLAALVLTYPLMGSLNVQFFNLSNPTFRISAAFALLAWSLWSYSERQYANGYWIAQTVCAAMAWGAASLYFLTKGSAMIGQFFGFFATLCGALVICGLFFSWRNSYRVSAGFLVALPLLFLIAGALFTNVSPLPTMALALPFLVSAMRPNLEVSGHALREVLIVGFFSALSVAWVAYQALN